MTYLSVPRSPSSFSRTASEQAARNGCGACCVCGCFARAMRFTRENGAVAMFLKVAVVFAASMCVCDAQQVQRTAFSCDGRTSGYYADVSAGCQVYHMCDGLGRQFSYRCPKDTLFQQRMLICDHWYMVNCSKAEEDYSANLLIGQKGIPFVADYNQYTRTPRPDLVDPVNPAYKTYRMQQQEQQQSQPVANIVGAEDDNEKATTDDYFPPSHWSTEYISESTTRPQVSRQNTGDSRISQSRQTYYRTTYNTVKKLPTNEGNRPNGKALDLESSNRNNNDFLNTRSKGQEANVPKGFTQRPVVNFPSKFQATTPDYPQKVDIDLFKFSGLGEKPPLEKSEDSGTNGGDFNQQVPAKINYPSRFQATTPVYPEKVDVDLSKFLGTEEQPPLIEGVDNNLLPNYASNFKATTPVYPLSVEATSPEPDGAGILPPLNQQNGPPEEDGTVNNLVNFNSNFQATTPDYPKFVEPTSPNPAEIGLVPPQINGTKEIMKPLPRPFGFNTPNADIAPPIPAVQDIKASKIYPEIILEGEDVEQSILKNTFNSKQLNDYMSSMKPEQLKGLRGMWHIPDYDFPLEPAPRPGYDSSLSSFQAKPQKKR